MDLSNNDLDENKDNMVYLGEVFNFKLLPNLLTLKLELSNNNLGGMLKVWVIYGILWIIYPKIYRVLCLNYMIIF